MRILAIDTSSIVATCAILDEEKLVGEYILNHKRTHSQKLMPIIKEVLESCDLKPKDIDVYAAAIGPGSFTGLRIGLATIKALAHVEEKYVVGIPTMDAMAYNMPFADGIIVPMMDARRDRVYTGMYRWQGDTFEVMMEQDVVEVDVMIEKLLDQNKKIIINGDGGKVYKEKLMDGLGDRVVFAPNHVNMPKASSVAELAMKKVKAGKLESYLELVPEYLRKSQAEREYDQKMCCGGNDGGC